MTRKCLITLALIALCAGSVAQAHPYWPIEYGPKAEESIEVKMLVVRWADIYGQEAGILMAQVNSTDFEGCIDLTVCANFDMLKVIGKIIPLPILTTGTNAPQGVKANGGWEISMESADSGAGTLSGAGPVGFQLDETWIVFTTNSVTKGSLMPLKICVAARDVDPQSQLYTVGNKIPVATVELTMLPDVPVDDSWHYDP